jgi:hypothetical protein
VGKSDASAGYYSTRQFAQDAANEALGINEPAHIIGHSMEGGFANGLPSIIRAKYAV